MRCHRLAGIFDTGKYRQDAGFAQGVVWTQVALGGMVAGAGLVCIVFNSALSLYRGSSITHV